MLLQLLLLLFVKYCSGHTETICTSSGGTGSIPNSAKLWLLTYSHGSTSARGSVEIEYPDRTHLSVPFSSISKSLNDDEIIEEKIRALPDEPDDTIVYCFFKETQDASSRVMVSARANTKSVSTKATHPDWDVSKIVLGAPALVTNLQNGIYEVWTENTNVVYTACTGNEASSYPCSISSTDHKFFWFPVFDGGSSCNEEPTVPTFIIDGINVSAIPPETPCIGTLSGLSCPVMCPTDLGYFAVENKMLYCKNGTWIYDFTCSKVQGVVQQFDTYAPSVSPSEQPSCFDGQIELPGGACEACEPGLKPSTDGTRCIPCEGGTYSPGFQKECLVCPSGFYSFPGTKQCRMCPAGTFSKQNSSKCSPCLVGTTSDAGSSTCEPCSTQEDSYGSYYDYYYYSKDDKPKDGFFSP